MSSRTEFIVEASTSLALIVVEQAGKVIHPGLNNVSGGSSRWRIGKSLDAAVRRVPAEFQPRRLVAGAGREMRHFFDMVEHLIDRGCRCCPRGPWHRSGVRLLCGGTGDEDREKEVGGVTDAV